MCHVHIKSVDNTWAVFPFCSCNLIWLGCVGSAESPIDPLCRCCSVTSWYRSSCWAGSLLTTQVCEQSLCLCLLCVAVECVSLFAGPDVLRKWWDQGGRIPPPKKVWIYSRESGSESQWSLPPTRHYNFLGSVQGEIWPRDRKEELKIETQSGKTTRWGRRSGKTSTIYTLFPNLLPFYIKHTSHNAFH